MYIAFEGQMHIGVSIIVENADLRPVGNVDQPVHLAENGATVAAVGDQFHRPRRALKNGAKKSWSTTS